MENLLIKSTPQTPKISFNLNGNLLLKGISVPENVHDFYDSIGKWIDELNNNLPPHIIITLDLDYFNTSTALTIHGLLIKLINYEQRGVSLKIIWKYNKDDEDMYDAGMMFQNRINHQFEFVEK